VELKIYNLLGQVVNTLVNENQDAGSYQITWNGIDESGNCVPRGIYFCTFSYCNKKMIKKLVLY
ncbi:MAG: T9SS type A sorting domain-containing protein, partial [candidate division WOR-3 bacterium]|nr:T9SS type A sorting domain-containing protein [candidate division WOR-3 bacterium]